MANTWSATVQHQSSILLAGLLLGQDGVEPAPQGHRAVAGLVPGPAVGV